MNNSKKSQEKLDRKTVERNRRMQMKALCFKLTSLIPRQHLIKPSKDTLSVPDQLDQATTYIKQLKERVEELKRRKKVTKSNVGSNNSSGNSTMSGIRFPRFEFRDFGSGLEVILVTGINKKFMLYEIISILEQEGAEVVRASVSTIGDKVFYTIHAQVRVSRFGVDTSSLCERLQELIS